MASTVGVDMMDLLGAGFGFCLTLALFSLLAGDRALARLAQHLLVGAALGYVAVVVWRDILQPRLWAPLGQGQFTSPWIWSPLGLGLLLVVGGVATISRQGQPLLPEPAGGRWLRWLALLPAALVAGVGLAVGIIGVIQGSLLPQLWRTIGTGIDWSAPLDTLASRLLTLLVTTATLLALTVGNADRFVRPTAWFHPLLAGWIGLGKRAFWLAAGALFARLAASYLSLLIGQITYLLSVLAQFGLWQKVP